MSLIDIYNNPDDAMDFFVFLFNTVLNENAPKQTKRVKHLLQPNWYNADISKASRKKDFYHQIKDAENYIIWRNRVKALIRSSKRSYYAQAINDNERNARQLWKSLHELTNKQTRSTSFSIHDANGEPILDPEQTADTFNKFFVSIHESYNINNIQSLYENKK